MNTYLRIAALTGLLLAAAHSALAQTTHGSLRSEGAEPNYILYRPEGLPAGAPLVVFLHGYGGRNDPARYGLNETADRHGFAVCYPEGAPDERGKRGWNVGYPTQGNMPDDVAFVERLVRHLQRRYGLSRRNVFCTGMSNGGDFCYVVASRRPKLFAALASVAGFMSVGDMRTDRSATPVPLLEIHGTADRTTRWDGDPDNEGGWGAYVAVPLAARYWAAKARCTRMERDTLPIGRPEGLQVVAHRSTDGIDGCEVWLYETIGGKHSWRETGVDTPEAVWSFFAKYLR